MSIELEHAAAMLHDSGHGGADVALSAIGDDDPTPVVVDLGNGKAFVGFVVDTPSQAVRDTAIDQSTDGRVLATTLASMGWRDAADDWGRAGAPVLSLPQPQ